MLNLVSSEVFKFADRSLIQTVVDQMQFTWQRHLSDPAVHPAVDCPGGIPVLHPSDHDPSAIRCQNGLWRIEINTVVNGLVMFLREVQILICTSDQAKCSVAIVIFKSSWQHVLWRCDGDILSIQFKEVRTLPHQAKPTLVLNKNMIELPVDQIFAAEQKQLPIVVTGLL